MGHYIRGDVVIAPVAIDERSVAKTRPAVVIAMGAQGEVYLCPVSSKPSSDGPSVPISLDDFSSGGVDLFGESYVLTSRVSRIPCREIIGKKEDFPTKLPQLYRAGCPMYAILMAV